MFVFLSYWKNIGTEKRVRIIHEKRAIRVRAIEVILYISDDTQEIPKQKRKQKYERWRLTDARTDN